MYGTKIINNIHELFLKLHWNYSYFLFMLFIYVLFFSLYQSCKIFTILLAVLKTRF